MSTYKVLQDIEGEDHLVLWLTPKQTIYAAIAIVSIALAYVLGRLNILMAVPWLLPIGFFGFLAAPLGKDQPNDVWAAAQLRFYFKNRKRIWDQSGMQELVHITVPKKEERYYTDGLNQSEVRSRLKALSTTIDSRGWAIKNSTVNISMAPQFTNQFTQANDERLVGSESLPQDVGISDVTAADDIMDETSNSVAHRFDEQIKKQEADHKELLRLQMLNKQTQAPTPTQPSNTNDYYFLNQPSPQDLNLPDTGGQPVQQLATFSSQIVAPGSDDTTQSTTVTADDSDPTAQALLEKIHHEQELAQETVGHSHERVLKTSQQIAQEERQRMLAIAEQRRREQEAEQHKIAQEKLTQSARANTAPDAIIKELSQSELKISTIATQAKHSVEASNKDGEVVISLH